MEQSSHLQGLVEQQLSDPEPIIEWNEESAEIEFRGGVYHIRGLSSAYSTKDKAEKAWRKKLSKEKLSKIVHERKRALTEFQKTQSRAARKTIKRTGKDIAKWSNP